MIVQLIRKLFPAGGTASNTKASPDRPLAPDEGQSDSGDLYRSIVQSIDGIVWECMAETLVFTYVSPQCKRILGHDPEAWCSTPGFWQEHIHPDDREHAISYCSTQVQLGRNHDFEYRMRKADGSYLWLRDIVAIHDDGTGEARMRGVMFDISREKELERGLEKIIEDLQRFLTYSPNLVGIANREGYFEMVNPAFTQLLGYSELELTSRPFTEFVHPEDLDRTRRQYEENMKSGNRTMQFENRYLTADGGWKWISWHSSYWIEEDDKVLAYGHDITSLKQANLELRQLSLVASHTTDSVIITDPEGRITWVNDAFTALTGYTLEESYGKKPGSFLQGPDTDQETVRRLREAVREKRSIHEEILNYSRDGSSYWLDLNINPVFDERGICTKFIAIERDVTAHKREKIRLRQLESVITNTDEAVAIIEAVPSELPGRRILYVNEGFCRMTGYQVKEVIGETLHFLNGSNTNEIERTRLRNVMKEYRPAKAEFVNYRKNGEEFWVQISMIPVQDKKGNYTHWISIGRDITERKQQQQQILESLREKETLLSEIHHRVKNNLAVVSGMMLLQAEGEGNEEVSRRLLDSVGRIKTMATIHEQLYQSNNFSRLEFSENIRTLVQTILGTFQHDQKIDLELNCESVELNINQAIPCSLIVNEVMTNILKYAFRGRRTGKVIVDLKHYTNDPCIQLVISDNGVGLPEDITIQRSRTLGMNLIEVLSDQLHATYRYESPGEGTRFSLSFVPMDIKGAGNTTF